MSDNAFSKEVNPHVEEAQPVKGQQLVTDAELSGEDPRVKKIKRKVDLRLSVILALLYIVNQIVS
jgi:hypothetical protein